MVTNDSIRHARQHQRERLMGAPVPHLDGCPDCEPTACADCQSVAYNEKGIIHFFDCSQHGDNPPHVTFSGHE